MPLTKEEAEKISEALCAAGHLEHDVTEETETVHTGRWGILLSLEGATPEAIEKIAHDLRIPGTRLERVYDQGETEEVIAVSIT